MTTPRAEWEPEYDRVFVDLCVEHKMLGNLPRIQHILKPFQKKTGARFTRNQLKNYWDTKVKEWKIWCRLVQCKDMKWDRQTNTFGASDQEWTNYLQVNRKAGRYRRNPPMYLDKLEFIFGDMNLDGEGSSSGSKRKRRRCEDRDGENDTEEATLRASNIATRASNIATRASNIRTRLNWPPSSHELFVNLCFHESVEGERSTRHNGNYPKETWNKMLETINKETGVGYTLVQLRHHWEVTREAWKKWCQTIDAPILKWDANTCQFGATNEDWVNYLKENPKAEAFRWKHIPHADKLATIFKGRIEPGNAQTRPYRKRVIDHHSKSPQIHEPAPSSAVYTNDSVTESDERADDDEDNDDDDHDEPTPLIWLDSEDDETVTPGCHRFNTKLMEKIRVDAPVKKNEYTIAECIKCLDAMEQVEKGSVIYMFALDLFLKKEHREIFLLLKTSSLRMSWLLRRRFGGPTIAA